MHYVSLKFKKTDILSVSHSWSSWEGIVAIVSTDLLHHFKLMTNKVLQHSGSTYCISNMEPFHITSQQPYWCSKTIKRQSYWGTKPILWKLISFLMLTLSFVPINLHGCCSREWKRFMVQQYRLEALREGLSSALSWPLRVESLLTFPAVSISSTFNGHPSTSISVS